LTGEDHDQIHAFEWWFMSRNLTILKSDAEQKDEIIKLASKYGDKERLKFYREFLQTRALLKAKL